MKNKQLFTPSISQVNFTALLKALACPGAFPFPIPEDEPIRVVQTHASAVLLTPERVYKVKKPENLGFLNYSTAKLRRHFCQQEVYLNAPLAPQVYLGVAPVLAYSSGCIRFGPTFPVEIADQQDIPHPGTIFEGGEVIDYAVVMVRLPEEATLEYRSRHGTVTIAQLTEIAHAVADFHKRACTNERITRFGALATILANWGENFAQMLPSIGRTLDKATFESIQKYVHAFMQARTSLFTFRQLDGRIRDCHGDLRLQHIYLLEKRKKHSSNLAILDRIEFNDASATVILPARSHFFLWNWMHWDDLTSRAIFSPNIFLKPAIQLSLKSCHSIPAIEPVCVGRSPHSNWISQRSLQLNAS